MNIFRKIVAPYKINGKKGYISEYIQEIVAPCNINKWKKWIYSDKWLPMLTY